MSKSGGTALNDLKKDLAAGSIGSIYIFYGEERYLIEYYVGSLKKKLIEAGTEDFNYFNFDGKNINYENLVNSVEGLPIFSARKMVVVKDMDLFRLKEGEREIMEELLADVPEECCIVFVYESVEFRADKRTKFYKQVAKSARLVEIGIQNPNELVSWIKRHFRAQNKVIDNSVAEHMLFICGKLMAPLQSEISKVAAYAKGEKIQKSDIDAVCVPVADAVVFSITDAVLDKNYTEALHILDNLYRQEHDPIPLLALIGKQIRQLYSIRLVQDSRAPGMLSGVFGIHSGYVARKLINASKRMNLDWYRNALRLCVECDLALKSQGDKDHKKSLLVHLLLQLNGLQV